jgi:hypothetical protein
MKTSIILTTITLFISASVAQAQTKRVSISEVKGGAISAEHIKSINLESGDTLSYVYMGFQNSKYTTITDIVSIMISNSETLEQMVSDLEAAIPEIKSGTDIRWKREDYDLTLYDFSKHFL